MVIFLVSVASASCFGQTRSILLCSHTQSIDADEGSDQSLELKPCCMQICLLLNRTTKMYIKFLENFDQASAINI